MSENYNATEICLRMTPAYFLARLGFHPAYESGKEFFYLSMLRRDRKPSFRVNTEIGAWYDSGGANASGIKSGNVIDLALAYWYPLSLNEVLIKMSELCNMDQISVATTVCGNRRPRKATKLPHYLVSEIKELGNNQAITSYLQIRRVWPVAHEHVKEVYYYLEDEKQLRKYYFSAGWQNENGGWQVASPYFTGCLGTKGLTIIAGDPSRLVLFESMTDYLSWKFEQVDSGETIIVLNQYPFIGAAIKRAADFDEKTIFFSNDQDGQSAALAFLSAYPGTNNRASTYPGYKNYNDMLISELDKLYRTAASPAIS